MVHDRKYNPDRTTKDRYAPSSNVDEGILDNLSKVVSTLGDQGESKDFRPLIVFFQKGFLSQIVQVWSYYAQVNNHPKFSKTTNLLVSVLRLLNSDESIHEYGSSLIELVLNGHIKVLYRGVNNIRASITNPILRLMRQMVAHNSGQHVELFVANFDLSLPSLIRILSVNKADIAAPADEPNNSSKSTIRATFLDFWLEVISQCSPFARKQLLLTNSKIMGAWFKLMDKVDSPETMSRTLDVFTNLILREPSYKRMTKCKILNELALSKLHTFYYSSDRSLATKVNDFFLAYGSDQDSSVAFPDDAVWFLDSPISGTHKGVEISVKQRHFKIYNKLLFNVLRIFKPWEDDMQLSTVIKILDNVPELVAPYAAFLASLGAHDPKMTSYWFGCTTLLGRMIRLKIPLLIEQVEADTAPDISLVMESIIPSSLSKSALNKSLQHEKLIIKQLACQLIIFAFKKLEVVLDLYDRKGWISSKASLRNSFHLNLPDLPVLSSVMTQSYESSKENKILQLSLSTILKHYSAIFPNFFGVKLSSSNVFIDTMQSGKFSGMDLAILESFLSWQELNGLQTKWWSRANQEQSFFTSLLSVARDSSNSLTEKICQLMNDMFRGSVLFNSGLECSPHRALIRSLQSITHESGLDKSKIWRILDQSIEHVMRIPYKYVDLSADYDHISPFIVALLEQCKYASPNQDFDICQKWIGFYLRTMIICGEPEEGVKSAAKNLLSEACQRYIEEYLSSATVESVEERQLRDSLMASSFSDLIIFEKYSKLKNIIRSPISELDAAGLVFRMEALAKDLSIRYDAFFKSVMEDLITKRANYSATYRSSLFLSSRTLSSLLQRTSDPLYPEFIQLKSKYIIRLMLQMRQEIGPENSELQQLLFEWIQNNNQVLQSTFADDENVHFLSAIFSFIGLKCCLKILENRDKLSTTSMKLVSTVLLEQGDSCVHFSIIMRLLQDGSVDSVEIASQFMAQNRIQDLLIEDLLTVLMSGDSYSVVTQAFVSSRYYSPKALLSHLGALQGQKNALMLALGLYNYQSEDAQEFVAKVLKNSLASIESCDLQTSQLTLQLACECSILLSDIQKLELIGFLSNRCAEKYNANVIKCMIKLADFDDKDVLKWLNKTVLYVTKRFSSVTEMDPHLSEILSDLQNITDTVWQRVNKSILNSHIEAILSGRLVNQEIVMEYTLRVLLAIDKKSTSNERLMQCLLNNDSKELRNKKDGNYIGFLTACVLYVLYLADPAHNSTAIIQENILGSYEGSISAKDRIILKLLELIEAQTSLSWTGLIFSWDLIEEVENDSPLGHVNLITKRKEGLIITLNRQIIARSAINYTFMRTEVPNVEKSNSYPSWQSLSSFYQETEQSCSGVQCDVYDPLFLLLLSVQNEELVRTSKAEDGSIEYIFDVKAFLSSNIFQVVMCSLGDGNEIQSIALSLVEGMLSTLQKENCPKELRIFRILLSKIAFTFIELKTTENEHKNPIPPCIWFAISQLTLELEKPTSQLHEKAVRWVLSKPLCRSNDLPLFQELVHPRTNTVTDHSVYYKQLGWVLNVLQQGLKTESDVELIKRIGILEWLANLLNLPNINGKMRSAISAIFYTSQRLGNSGSSLITRAASIATFELQNISLEHKLQSAELEVASNLKNSRHLQKLLTLQQQSLNSVEVLSGNAILAGSSKRLREWAENDIANLEKRIKCSSVLKKID